MRADIAYNDVIDGEEYERAQAAADASADIPADLIDPTTFYVTQLWDKYNEENHRTWRELYSERFESLEAQASTVYLDGLNALELTPNHVPKLDNVNKNLAKLTGWKSMAVPGFLPAKAFFACLSRREFPATVTIRPHHLKSYLPEPDIFHDIFGHVPLHADPVFADFLQTYGKAALHTDDPYHITRLGRLFWFTVEFGLIKEDGRNKLYGSGLISSLGESEFVLTSSDVDLRPFDMDRVCDTPFEIHHFQPIVYVLESFEQLRDAMNSYSEQLLNATAGAMA